MSVQKIDDMDFESFPKHAIIFGQNEIDFANYWGGGRAFFSKLVNLRTLNFCQICKLPSMICIFLNSKIHNSFSAIENLETHNFLKIFILVRQ